MYSDSTTSTISPAAKFINVGEADPTISNSEFVISNSVAQAAPDPTISNSEFVISNSAAQAAPPADPTIHNSEFITHNSAAAAAAATLFDVVALQSARLLTATGFQPDDLSILQAHRLAQTLKLLKQITAPDRTPTSARQQNPGGRPPKIYAPTTPQIQAQVEANNLKNQKHCWTGNPASLQPIPPAFCRTDFHVCPELTQSAQPTATPFPTTQPPHPISMECGGTTPPWPTSIPAPTPGNADVLVGKNLTATPQSSPIHPDPTINPLSPISPISPIRPISPITSITPKVHAIHIPATPIKPAIEPKKTSHPTSPANPNKINDQTPINPLPPFLRIHHPFHYAHLHKSPLSNCIPAP